MGEEILEDELNNEIVAPHVTVNIDTQQIADALQQSQKATKVVIIEQHSIDALTKNDWVDCVSGISAVIAAIVALISILTIRKDLKRTLGDFERLSGTFKICNDTKSDVLTAELSIQNHGSDFVWLEFTKGEHDPKGQFSPNQIDNPIYIKTEDGYRVLKRFVYMKHKEQYHREIGIPPKNRIDITIEAGDGENMPTNINEIILRTAKQNLIKLKLKK